MTEAEILFLLCIFAIDVNFIAILQSTRSLVVLGANILLAGVAGYCSYAAAIGGTAIVWTVGLALVSLFTEVMSLVVAARPHRWSPPQRG